MPYWYNRCLMCKDFSLKLFWNFSGWSGWLGWPGGVGLGTVIIELTSCPQSEHYQAGWSAHLLRWQKWYSWCPRSSRTCPQNSSSGWCWTPAWWTASWCRTPGHQHPIHSEPNEQLAGVEPLLNGQPPAQAPEDHPGHPTPIHPEPTVPLVQLSDPQLGPALPPSLD